MNKYGLYVDSKGEVFQKTDYGYLKIGKVGHTPLDNTDIKPLVTPIMESFRDQPFCFGEEIEVSDDGKTWHNRRFSYFLGSSIPYPYITINRGYRNYMYARKIEQVTIDGVKMSKYEAEQKRDELQKRLDEIDEAIGDE